MKEIRKGDKAIRIWDQGMVCYGQYYANGFFDVLKTKYFNSNYSIYGFINKFMPVPEEMIDEVFAC